LNDSAEYRDSTSTIADHPPRRALALSRRALALS